MANVMIELAGVSKTYKAKQVLRDVNLRITKGEIFALIGQNGAGKSTLFKMIGGLVRPSDGEIHFFDRAQAVGNMSWFERMGLLIERPGLYPQYSGYENLKLLSMAYGLRKPRAALVQLLAQVGLAAASKKKVKHYSLGMKQRLGIAIALLGSPDVLVLDEPTNGLDPQGIVEIRKLLLELNKKGLTMIISSHHLEELAKVASQYAIIHHGEIIEVISRETLLQQCEERIELTVDEASEVLPILEQHMQLTELKVIDAQTIYIYDGDVAPSEVVRQLVTHGQHVHAITKHKMSLEQYFLQRTESAGEPS